MYSYYVLKETLCLQRLTAQWNLLLYEWNDSWKLYLMKYHNKATDSWQKLYFMKYHNKPTNSWKLYFVKYHNKPTDTWKLH